MEKIYLLYNTTDDLTDGGFKVAFASKKELDIAEVVIKNLSSESHNEVVEILVYTTAEEFLNTVLHNAKAVVEPSIEHHSV